MWRKWIGLMVLILLLGSALVMAVIAADDVDDVANSDIPVSGTVTGDYTATHSSDDEYEAIRETLSSPPFGVPGLRYSHLEHKWTFDVTGADRVTFYVEAFHSANNEYDHFNFAYSIDSESYHHMLTVTKTLDSNTYQSFELPYGIAGALYVRVEDTNNTYGRQVLDTIYVDHMVIRSETLYEAYRPKPVDGAYAHRNAILRWEPGEGAVSHDVYFGVDYEAVNDANDPHTEPGRGNQPETVYVPGVLAANTWYYWRIDEVDGEGNRVRGDVWSFRVVPDLRETPPPEVEPIGGGVGYDGLLEYGEDYFDDDIVYNKDELLGALATANPGDVIYVDDGAEIDLTGMVNITIPEGITLASGRGKIVDDAIKLGARLYTTERTNPLFTVSSPDVRITGLRLEGPGIEEENPGSRGIRVTTHETAEIDNCEIYYWGYAGIYVSGIDGFQPPTSIHHNYIHDTYINLHASPLGYGIEVRLGEPRIWANVFGQYRHAIAGHGLGGCSYEAAYNIVLSGTAHAFDMHGKGSWRWKPWCYQCWPWCAPCQAGSLIDIHHNLFVWTEETGVTIRGQPSEVVDIHDNWFFHEEIGGWNVDGGAVKQKFTCGNFSVHDNVLTPDAVPQGDPTPCP